MTTLKTAVYQTISSLALDVLLSKLASLILFQGALFSGVDGFSSKLEKKNRGRFYSPALGSVVGRQFSA